MIILIKEYIDNIYISQAFTEKCVIESLLNSYDKALMIMEYYEGDDVESFSIFQEMTIFQEEDDLSSAFESKEGFNRAFRKFNDEGKKENILISIFKFIPRLVGLIIKTIKTKRNSKKVEKVAKDLTDAANNTNEYAKNRSQYIYDELRENGDVKKAFEDSKEAIKDIGNKANKEYEKATKNKDEDTVNEASKKAVSDTVSSKIKKLYDSFHQKAEQIENKINGKAENVIQEASIDKKKDINMIYFDIEESVMYTRINFNNWIKYFSDVDDYFKDSENGIGSEKFINLFKNNSFQYSNQKFKEMKKKSDDITTQSKWNKEALEDVKADVKKFEFCVSLGKTWKSKKNKEKIFFVKTREPVSFTDVADYIKKIDKSFGIISKNCDIVSNNINNLLEAIRKGEVFVNNDDMKTIAEAYKRAVVNMTDTTMSLMTYFTDIVDMYGSFMALNKYLIDHV